MSLFPRENWDEFKDLDIMNWKRIRLAIEHENHLINHRFSWLLSCQAFLFAAFTVVFKESTQASVAANQRIYYQILLSAFAMTGIIIAFYIQRPIRTAEIHHEVLVDWWNRNCQDLSRHPKIAGEPPEWQDKFLLQSRFPIVFIFAWLFTSLIIWANVFENFANDNADTIKSILNQATLILGGTVIGIMLTRSYSKRRPTQRQDANPQDDNARE